MSEQKTAFLTGATGFVGAAVARLLLDKGFSLRLLSRKGNDRRNLRGLEAVTLVEGDLNAPETYAEALKGCDALFHVAADYRIWVPDPARMYATNVDATEKLMLAAIEAGIGRIVYTSSVATLGVYSDGRVADETTPSSFATMIGPYKGSKYKAEETVKRLIDTKGLPCVIVNPSTPIGPRDVKPTPTGRMILEAAQGKMPAFVDTGLNVAHVDDVAMGHWLAYERGHIGERYILGGTNIGLGAILAMVAANTGRKAPSVKLPIAPLYPLAFFAELAARFTGKEPMLTMDGLRMARKKMFFSSAKAEQALGYAPRPAEEAIRDAVAWFRANGYL